MNFLSSFVKSSSPIHLLHPLYLTNPPCFPFLYPWFFFPIPGLPPSQSPALLEIPAHALVADKRVDLSLQLFYWVRQKGKKCISSLSIYFAENTILDVSPVTLWEIHTVNVWSVVILWIYLEFLSLVDNQSIDWKNQTPGKVTQILSYTKYPTGSVTYAFHLARRTWEIFAKMFCALPKSVLWT